MVQRQSHHQSRPDKGSPPAPQPRLSTRTSLSSASNLATAVGWRLICGVARLVGQVGEVAPGDLDVGLHGDIVVGVLHMVVIVRLQRSACFLCKALQITCSMNLTCTAAGNFLHLL